jgi:hypothetical protein
MFVTNAEGVNEQNFGNPGALAGTLAPAPAGNDRKNL